MAREYDSDREVYLSPVGYVKGSFQSVPNLFIHPETGDLFVKDSEGFQPASLKLEA